MSMKRSKQRNSGSSRSDDDDSDVWAKPAEPEPDVGRGRVEARRVVRPVRHVVAVREGRPHLAPEVRQGPRARRRADAHRGPLPGRQEEARARRSVILELRRARLRSVGAGVAGVARVRASMSPALGLAWARALPAVTLVPAFGLRAVPGPARPAMALALAACIFPALAPVAHTSSAPWMVLRSSRQRAACPWPSRPPCRSGPRPWRAGSPTPCAKRRNCSTCRQSRIARRPSPS